MAAKSWIACSIKVLEEATTKRPPDVMEVSCCVQPQVSRGPFIRRALAFHLGRYRIPNLAQRWQDSHERERPTIDDFLAVDQNGQLAVVALDQRGFHSQFFP